MIDKNGNKIEIGCFVKSIDFIDSREVININDEYDWIETKQGNSVLRTTGVAEFGFAVLSRHQIKNHYVVRTYSHTDKQLLWKVLSRPIKDLSDANVWLEHEKSLSKNKKHEFFIVTK